MEDKWKLVFGDVTVPPCRPMFKYHYTDDMVALHAGEAPHGCSPPFEHQGGFASVLINQ